MTADAASPWPPLPVRSNGHLPLTGPVEVGGPWTDEVRSALRVLDPMPGPIPPGGTTISTARDANLPPEAYHLAVTTDGITIAASDRRGALQACTTIRQLLPAEAWRATAVRRDDWRLPVLTLDDAPAWPYRGFMLDVSRHFAPVPELLRWIELAAMHRLNHLHLHLTDDQGWRLPSAAYPRLVEVASWRHETWVGHNSLADPAGQAAHGDGAAGHGDGTPHGGHYTVADLREITDHAERHGITVVPEVDLPGHASALLAAIPELGVPGCPPQSVATSWGLLGRTISPLPGAMRIIETLLGEVADAIDSPYLHIGGDEADLAMWRDSAEVRALAEEHGGMEPLRARLNGDLARIVLGLGRRPIAWDDAFVAGGLPLETVIMPWRSERLGREAAAAGHDVVMTPVLPTYLDYAEATGPDEPLSIGAPLTVTDVAGWTPPEAGPGALGRVLGGQAQLWTEYTPDAAAREYRAFPRLAILAANLWRGAPVDLDAESAAVAEQLARLDARHVNHRPLTGPHPWQRAGSGARAPMGVLPMAVVAEYLDRASAHAEPPPL
jgi:hexosaminidase